MPGILTDSAIAAALNQGDIKINPWNPEQLNPCSYDLTLGDEVRVYTQWVAYDTRYAMAAEVRDGSDLVPIDRYLDIKEEPETVSFKIDPKRGWILKPGIGYLMHTAERIWTGSYVPIVDGKSSIGRLFVQIHATAGFGDAGFDGQYTLEVIVQHPIKVYPGMRIGQIRFHTIEGEIEADYAKRQSNYTGDAAKGAVPSRAFRMFEKLGG